jgi:hypothetical protein
MYCGLVVFTFFCNYLVSFVILNTFLSAVIFQ